METHQNSIMGLSRNFETNRHNNFLIINLVYCAFCLNEESWKQDTASSQFLAQYLQYSNWFCSWFFHFQKISYIRVEFRLDRFTFLVCGHHAWQNSFFACQCIIIFTLRTCLPLPCPGSNICLFHNPFQPGPLVDDVDRRVLKNLRWCIRHHSAVEKSAGLNKCGLSAGHRFDSGRNPVNSNQYGFEQIDPQTRVLDYFSQ